MFSFSDRVAASDRVVERIAALSCATGKPFQIKLPAPGMSVGLNRHIHALASLCKADLVGCKVESTSLAFAPKMPAAGTLHRFDLGNQGSAMNLAIDLIPILACAPAPSTVCVTGATHRQGTLSAEYVETVLIESLRLSGMTVALHNPIAGYLSDGQIHVHIAPSTLHGLDLSERGVPQVADIYFSVTNTREQELSRAIARLEVDLAGFAHRVHVRERPGDRKGVSITVVLRHNYGPMAAFCGTAVDGVGLEAVVAEVCYEFQEWVDGERATDDHLPEELPIPLAFAVGPSILPLPSRPARFLELVEAVTEFIGWDLRIEGDFVVLGGSKETIWQAS